MSQPPPEGPRGPRSENRPNTARDERPPQQSQPRQSSGQRLPWAHPPKAEPQSRRRSADTGATTAGLLPDAVGLVLVALVVSGVVALGAAMGLLASDVAIVCLAGLVGAVGVRAAATGESRRVAGGVALLWLAALGFTAGTASLVSESGSVAQAGVTLVAASAALLGPFAVLGSTVRLYGHGTGKLVLRRYTVGTLVLGGIALGLLVAAVVWTNGWSVVTGVASAALGGSALVRRVVVAGIVYAAALFLAVRTARTFPAPVFVSPAEFDRIVAVRATVDRVSRYGWFALAAYAVLGVVLLVAGTGDAELAEPSRLVLRFVSHPAFVGGVALVALLLAGWLVALRSLQSVGSLTRTTAAEILLPPSACAVVVVLASVLFDGRIDAVIVSQLGQSGITEFLTTYTASGLLLGLALVLLGSALILSVPTIVAGQSLGDDSLAGVASGVLALVVLLVLALFTGQGVVVVVGGTVLAAVVWEFGEFATVASGELDTGAAAGGFSRLAAVHAVATAVIAIVGAVFALGVALLVGGTVLPAYAAVTVALVAGIGIAVLTLLLTG